MKAVNQKTVTFAYYLWFKLIIVDGSVHFNTFGRDRGAKRFKLSWLFVEEEGQARAGLWSAKWPQSSSRERSWPRWSLPRPSGRTLNSWLTVDLSRPFWAWAHQPWKTTLWLSEAACLFARGPFGGGRVAWERRPTTLVSPCTWP